MEMDCREEVEDLKITFDDYNIAVECVLFDQGLNWVLMERGSASRDEVGKLEGIGGGLEDGESPVEGLKRELREEVGPQADIDIIDYLGAKELAASEQEGAEENWVVLTYLGKLKKGELRVMEPEKNKGFQKVAVEQVETGDLSSSAKKTKKMLMNSDDWKKFRQ